MLLKDRNGSYLERSNKPSSPEEVTWGFSEDAVDEQLNLQVSSLCNTFRVISASYNDGFYKAKKWK